MYTLSSSINGIRGFANPRMPKMFPSVDSSSQMINCIQFHPSANKKSANKNYALVVETTALM